MDRRSFLRAAGAGFAATLLHEPLRALERADQILASACRLPGGAHALALFTERGEILKIIDLPGRGHDVVVHHQSRRAAVFARRPGTFALALDGPRQPPVTFATPPGRHFYGHGTFSAAGDLLYATENDFEAARGVIGVYDATDGYRRVGEFGSGGVGPHELALLGDGRTLVVANGGIETHPDFGRAKLNLGTMSPSLAIIDPRHGEIIERQSLPPASHQLSIRHLAVDRDGTVWFGCQSQDRVWLAQPVGHYKPGGEARLLDLPDDAATGMQGYVGAVAVSGDLVAFSSPVGNALLTLDRARGTVHALRHEPEVCGVADGTAGLIATSLRGAVLTADRDGARTDMDLRWDNHLIALRGVI